MKSPLLQKLLVEYVGTIFFLYVIISTGNAVAIGGALALCILVGGAISGGNFNPAVSIMMTLAGKLPMHDAIPYILSQVAGGITALLIHKYVRL
jgi:glycerol uptake facilitator-like aquaporin